MGVKQHVAFTVTWEAIAFVVVMMPCAGLVIALQSRWPGSAPWPFLTYWLLAIFGGLWLFR